jgi:hypothetical protein
MFDTKPSFTNSKWKIKISPEADSNENSGKQSIMWTMQVGRYATDIIPVREPILHLCMLYFAELPMQRCGRKEHIILVYCNE